MIFLVRQFDIYHFRRRVPKSLRLRLGSSEIYRTLNTSNKRLAKVRAALLFAASEELFQLAAMATALSDEDLRAAARRWLKTPMWQGRLKSEVDELLPGDLREQHDSLARRLVTYDDDFIGEHAQGARRGELEAEEATAALVSAGYREPDRETVQRMHGTLLAVVQEYVDKRVNEVFRPEKLVTTAVTPIQLPKPSPLFSEVIEPFFAEKSRGSEGHRPYSKQTEKQGRVTVRLWLDLIGDKPVRSYTGGDAGRFRTLLLRMPASHGKGRTPIDAMKTINQADGEGEVPRLKMKTVKRHFSILSQIWLYLLPNEFVERNVFAGFSFPGTSSKKRNRDDWSPEQLAVLFRSERWRRGGTDAAEWWLPLVSLFSGMRLEEICRLRPREDIQRRDGYDCFVIQEQPAMQGLPPWSPKSEAGARTIPIHGFLKRLGFLDLVARRLADGSERVFPELRPGGPDNKLGAAFSREFSKYKIDLGIKGKVVFHSFRHNFRTVLESTDFKTSWIDAVVGHEGGSGLGKTYTKRVEVRRLDEVVQAFTSPYDLSFLCDAASRRRAV